MKDRLRTFLIDFFQAVLYDIAKKNQQQNKTTPQLKTPHTILFQFHVWKT